MVVDKEDTMASIDKKTQNLLNWMDEQSSHVPTVYDCDGCKYNVGLIKGEHCRGCRIPDGSNWIYRQRPINYEQEVTTFTTQTGTGDGN